jgi:hypothetical protein
MHGIPVVNPEGRRSDPRSVLPFLPGSTSDDPIDKAFIDPSPLRIQLDEDPRHLERSFAVPI